MILDVGDRLIATGSDRFHRHGLNGNGFADIEWFRFPGESRDAVFYGPYVATFVLRRRIELLNLGSGINRDMILNHTTLTHEDFQSQYSSHGFNYKVHKAILDSSLFQKYDGTVIFTDSVDEFLSDDLGLYNEVVLFTDRASDALVLVDVSRGVIPVSSTKNGD